MLQLRKRFHFLQYLTIHLILYQLLALGPRKTSSCPLPLRIILFLFQSSNPIEHGQRRYDSSIEQRQG